MKRLSEMKVVFYIWIGVRVPQVKTFSETHRMLLLRQIERGMKR